MKDKTKFIPADEVYRYLIATMEVFQMTSRRTGRTTAMLDAVKPGDCIIVKTDREADRLRGMIADRPSAKQIDIVVLAADIPGPPPHMRRNYSTIHFDHEWLHQFYQGAIIKHQQALHFFASDFTYDFRNALPGEVREASYELSRFALHPRDRVWER